MEEKQVDQKKRWDWLPAHMPKIAQLMAERREKHGAAWAAEGPIAIGTLVLADPTIAGVA